jgi:hypothetical protein
MLAPGVDHVVFISIDLAHTIAIQDCWVNDWLGVQTYKCNILIALQVDQSSLINYSFISGKFYFIKASFQTWLTKNRSTIFFCYL